MSLCLRGTRLACALLQQYPRTGKWLLMPTSAASKTCCSKRDRLQNEAREDSHLRACLRWEVLGPAPLRLWQTASKQHATR